MRLRTLKHVSAKAGGILPVIAAAGIIAAAAGCYRHVVRESGPGSREDVHESNLKESKIEKALYGEESK